MITLCFDINNALQKPPLLYKKRLAIAVWIIVILSLWMSVNRTEKCGIIRPVGLIPHENGVDGNKTQTDVVD